MPSTEWASVAQSLGVILTTPKLKRYMRRAFGADLARLVDAPMNPVTVIDFYAACASAIGDYEPRFAVSRMSIDNATPGNLSLLAEGVYYPRGHLGDFTVSKPTAVTVPL